MNVIWEAGQQVLTVEWRAEGCIWLTGGPALDQWVEGACGPAGRVELRGLAGGDRAYSPLAHRTVTLRSQATGQVVAEVPIPARAWAVVLPVVAH